MALGNEILYPPDYDGFTPPPAGGSYTDPVFGSKITRISDALKTPDAADSGNLEWITGEYSGVCPFNADNSQILLVHESYFGLYDGQRYVGHLPFEANASSEPKWSRKESAKIYYVHGNQLKSYDTDTFATGVVRAFSEYTAIKGMGESDISQDGDHMVLCGDGRHVFRYRISTNTKSPVFDTGGKAFDSLYITPDNNVTISWIKSGSARYNGIELFDGNMRFQRQVARAGGHMDVCRDTDGSEVLIWPNSNDPQPLCENGIIKVRLGDGQQTCLLSLGWSPADHHLAVHISAPDNAGFAFVTTYAPSNPNAAGWTPYANEIMKVKLDGSGTERLCHHRSRPWNDYNWQPKASCSRDGSRFIFSSNFNLRPNPEYSDVYLMVLGETTPPTPTPVPVPPPPTPPPADCDTATIIKRLAGLEASMKTVVVELKAIKAAVNKRR